MVWMDLSAEQPGDLPPAASAGLVAPGALGLPSAANSADYRPSHRRILRCLDFRAATAGEAQRLGAVVVPTHRPLVNGQPGLDLAARLAAHFDCALVVLCGGAARGAEI